jgi:hypothetical protein
MRYPKSVIAEIFKIQHFPYRVNAKDPLNHMAKCFYNVASPVQFVLDCSRSLFFGHAWVSFRRCCFGIVIPAARSVFRTQRCDRPAASESSATVHPGEEATEKT